MAAARNKSSNHDDEDVKVSLAERAQIRDGSGVESEGSLPDSDFVAFAEDGVEMTEENPK